MILWAYRGRQLTSSDPQLCPFCGEESVVAVPDFIRATFEGDDQTDMLCLTCNSGFEWTGTGDRPVTVEAT